MYSRSWATEMVARSAKSGIWPQEPSWLARYLLLHVSPRQSKTDTAQIIHVEAKKEMRRRIVRELQIMHDTNSEYIVNFYGAFLSDNNDVVMCMEYMDVGYDACFRKTTPTLTFYQIARSDFKTVRTGSSGRPWKNRRSNSGRPYLSIHQTPHHAQRHQTVKCLGQSSRTDQAL